jgi:hypothetical protein
MKHPLLLLASLAVLPALYSQSYYVDLGNGPSGASGGNVLNWPVRTSDATANQTGLALVDFATGAASSITISTAGFDGYGPSDGRDLSAVGDVGTYLSPVNFFGSISVAQGSGSLKIATITFNNLDPLSTYALTLSGDRNNDTGRTSIFTIVGADTFTNASSTGTTIFGAANESTKLVTGNNSAGLVARFLDITAADGSFTIELYSDSNRAYVNGLSLVTTSTVPEPASFALIFGAAALVVAGGRRRRT